ncbi:hypothetical protein BTHERMOSOX_1158 [Bathymodiolus thermophilus thioautotrophic gill symbiont]|nr:hypothetical protein BTHERMOSOX_1158 [Bathymodiolus thermophilus thioautotrophic gill symbiont]
MLKESLFMIVFYTTALQFRHKKTALIIGAVFSFKHINATIL